jgi:hypothetical protein
LADDDEVIEMGIEVYCRYHHFVGLEVPQTEAAQLLSLQLVIVSCRRKSPLWWARCQDRAKYHSGRETPPFMSGN